MAKGIKNLTKMQKDVLYSFTHYYNCALLYHTGWLTYFLDNKYSIHTGTARSLIKRGILKLKGFHLDYPYGPPYSYTSTRRRSPLLLMTKENRVQIALGTMEPACYVYELNPEYLEALTNIV